MNGATVADRLRAARGRLERALQFRRVPRSPELGQLLAQLAETEDQARRELRAIGPALRGATHAARPPSPLLVANDPR